MRANAIMDSSSPPQEVSFTATDGRLVRYFRYLGANGDWIRHGAFVELFPGGQIASKGEYVHGREEGMWRDFYSSGQLAAEGSYVNGKEDGWWRFWDETGREERSTFFREGVESRPGS